MKQKWLLTGTALMLAAALAGCGNTPAADQAAKISMEQAQEAALEAANIDAADADVSSATLSEVAGVTCYKVEFTSGDHTDVVVLTYQANNGTNDTRKVSATKGEDIAPLAANTFSYSGHAFLYWKSGDTIFKTNGTITPTDAMTLSAVWAKVNPDGSVELPGKDGKLEGPGNEKDDNVTVTPDKPNGTLDGPKADGSVEVKGDEATVTRPDPQNPDKKEDIKVPEGTVVEPDGTIKLPDGTVIAPDKRRHDLRGGGHRAGNADGIAQKAPLRPAARLLYRQAHVAGGILRALRPPKSGDLSAMGKVETDC